MPTGFAFVGMFEGADALAELAKHEQQQLQKGSGGGAALTTHVLLQSSHHREDNIGEYRLYQGTLKHGKPGLLQKFGFAEDPLKLPRPVRIRNHVSSFHLSCSPPDHVRRYEHNRYQQEDIVRQACSTDPRYECWALRFTGNGHVAIEVGPSMVATVRGERGHVLMADSHLAGNNGLWVIEQHGLQVAFRNVATSTYLTGCDPAKTERVVESEKRQFLPVCHQALKVQPSAQQLWELEEFMFRPDMKFRSI